MNDILLNKNVTFANKAVLIKVGHRMRELVEAGKHLHKNQEYIFTYMVCDTILNFDNNSLIDNHLFLFISCLNDFMSREKVDVYDSEQFEKFLLLECKVILDYYTKRMSIFKRFRMSAYMDDKFYKLNKYTQREIYYILMKYMNR